MPSVASATAQHNRYTPMGSDHDYRETKYSISEAAMTFGLEGVRWVARNNCGTDLKIDQQVIDCLLQGAQWPQIARAAMRGGWQAVARLYFPEFPDNPSEAEGVARALTALTLSHAALLAIILPVAKNNRANMGDAALCNLTTRLHFRLEWCYKMYQSRPGLKDELRKWISNLRRHVQTKTEISIPTLDRDYSEPVKAAIEAQLCALRAGKRFWHDRPSSVLVATEKVIKTGPLCDKDAQECAEFIKQIRGAFCLHPKRWLILWGNVSDTVYDAIICSRATFTRADKARVVQLLNKDPPILMFLAKQALASIGLGAPRRDWIGHTTSLLGEVHARVSGSDRPDFRNSGGRPSGAAHDFVLKVGQLYSLPLATNASAGHIRRARSLKVR